MKPVADLSVCIDTHLAALLPAEDAAPQVLHRAMRHAVLGGGKRLRPRLVLCVARACAATAEEQELALLAACAVELVHCASLVHDDLPSFDDAAERRGRPSVHARFGEAVAILAGDALLSLAFEVLAQAPPSLARRSLRIVAQLGKAAGSVEGIIGGQSLEDAEAPLCPESISRYHAMKTAALFRFAAAAGATVAGAVDVAEWGEIGQQLGMIHQMLDDLADVCGEAAALGKPVGQDAALSRPNAVHLYGPAAARARILRMFAACRARIHDLATEPAPLLALLDFVPL